MMIESPKGVENIEEIALVPGVGAIWIGTTDLSSFLGVGVPLGNKDVPLHPDAEAAVQKVLKGCLAKKVVCGIAATWASKGQIQKYIDQGFRLFVMP